MSDEPTVTQDLVELFEVKLRSLERRVTIVTAAQEELARRHAELEIELRNLSAERGSAGG